jgi:predicted PurR-regulated permease PerM
MLEKNYIFNRKLLLILLLSFIALLGVFQIAIAAEITSATIDKEIYLAGQTGHISVVIYNDKSENISVTELSATIDYYYADGTVYVQRFFTSADLPEEIEPGQTKTYQVPISLPTNIAPGYVNLIVRASTNLWVNATGRWISSDSPSYQVKLYVESPYKQSYEDSQEQLQDSEEELQSSQEQLEAQESANRSLSLTATLLGVTTLAFGAIVVFLMFMLRRPRPIAQPAQ